MKESMFSEDGFHNRRPADLQQNKLLSASRGPGQATWYRVNSWNLQKWNGSELATFKPMYGWPRLLQH